MGHVTEDSGTRRTDWLALVCFLALAGLPARGAGTEAGVVPFDLALLSLQDHEDAGGCFALRPAALLKRPGMKPALERLNGQIDSWTAPLRAGGIGIHIEDVEQLMGRIYFTCENRSGKIQIGLRLNVLRTTRDMDWVTLRDRCGSTLKQQRYRGETYVRLNLAISELLGGVKEGTCLWAADARTLILDDEKTIRAHIDAKVRPTQRPVPDCAAGWDKVSWGLFALMIDNRQHRLLGRSMTETEIKAAQKDPAAPEYHILQLFQNTSRLLVAFQGKDDFQLEVQASADTPAAAGPIARSFAKLLAGYRKEVEEARTEKRAPNAEALVNLRFVDEVLQAASVRRAGPVVTLHAQVPAGFNRLIASFGRYLVEGERWQARW